MDNQNVRPSSFVKGPVQMGDVNITLLTNFAGAELIQKCDKGFIRGAIINKILYASEIILNQRERMKDDDYDFATEDSRINIIGFAGWQYVFNLTLTEKFLHNLADGNFDECDRLVYQLQREIEIINRIPNRLNFDFGKMENPLTSIADDSGTILDTPLNTLESVINEVVEETNQFVKPEVIPVSGNKPLRKRKVKPENVETATVEIIKPKRVRKPAAKKTVEVAPELEPVS